MFIFLKIDDMIPYCGKNSMEINYNYIVVQVAYQIPFIFQISHRYIEYVCPDFLSWSAKSKFELEVRVRVRVYCISEIKINRKIFFHLPIKKLLNFIYHSLTCILVSSVKASVSTTSLTMSDTQTWNWYKMYSHIPCQIKDRYLTNLWCNIQLSQWFQNIFKRMPSLGFHKVLAHYFTLHLSTAAWPYAIAGIKAYKIYVKKSWL